MIPYAQKLGDRSGNHTQIRRHTAAAGGNPATEVETPTAPSPRNAPALAFDAKRQVLVLIGGIDRPGATQRLDVWELGADGWREALAPS